MDHDDLRELAVCSGSQPNTTPKPEPSPPTPPAKPPITEIERPFPLNAYYDSNRASYLLADVDGNWMSMSASDIKTRLAGLGFRRAIPKSGMSAAEKEIVRIQNERHVVYAGPLAGYRCGIHYQGGQKILVTTSPKLVEPRAGDWSTIRALTENRLGPEQSIYYYGWLQVALQALHSEIIRPGQALFECGPANCGKSLSQNLITELLGGRSAKPYPFMVGLTNFNRELFGAEHLMIDDEVATTDIRARRNFGSRLKNMVASEVQSCHGKMREAVSLRPGWRLSGNTNDETENIMVMPPLDGSLDGKLHLLHARMAQMPMPSRTPQERRAFWDRLVSELPAFSHFLLHEFQIPDKLIDGRFGIVHYHNPVVLEALNSLSPEIRFLDAFDEIVFERRAHKQPWVGSASDAQRLITEESTSMDIAQLFHFPTAAATFLGRLASRYPKRISYKRTNHSRLWTILPPDYIEAPNGQSDGGRDTPPVTPTNSEAAEAPKVVKNSQSNAMDDALDALNASLDASKSEK